jgi:hypothetical protein
MATYSFFLVPDLQQEAVPAVLVPPATPGGLLRQLLLLLHSFG